MTMREQIRKVLPKLRDFCLELLFTRHVSVRTLSNTIDTACPAFIHSEFLLIALQLSRELFNLFLEVFLASLCNDK